MCGWTLHLGSPHKNSDLGKCSTRQPTVYSYTTSHHSPCLGLWFAYYCDKMIGHAKEWFNYAVETNHGNHPKQCISETKREVGFYRHDQWGFARLADEVQTQCLQRRGWPPV